MLSITMKNGLIDQAEKFKKRIASSDTSNYRIAYKNELVVGFPIDEGVLGFQTKYPAGIVSPAYDIWRLKNEKDSHISYLERYLRSPQARSLYASRMQGAVARRRSLTKEDFLDLEVPFPPFDDQIRIALLLGKLEALIAQRKQHLQQVDDLLKSVFLEMFGDPVRNEKGWEKRPCSKVAEIITGYPFKSELYTDDPTQLRLCGGLIIYPQRIDWEKGNYWPRLLLPGLERYLLEVRDIVLAMDRPWISSGLKICTVDETGSGALLVQRTARLRANDVDQNFLYAHLKDVSFTRHCKPTETTVPHISIKDIQTYQVLYPPKKLQDKFSAIAKKIDRLKSRYQQSLSDLEDLYGALSQKAFKGELDLPRINLPQQPSAETGSEEELIEIAAPIKNYLDLPELPAELSLSGPGRRAALEYWFQAAVKATPGGRRFQISTLVDGINFRLTVMDDQEHEFSDGDYEFLKAWVFEALAAGTLKQTFDGASNRIDLKVAQA